MQPTQKMESAAKDLLRRYLAERHQRSEAGSYEPIQCIVKLDRLVLTAIAVSLQALCGIPGYRAKKPKRLWRQLYSIVTRILGTGSIREIIVESSPNAAWLPKFRITIIPRDTTGLLFEDLRFILELIPEFKLVLIEIALDFPLHSIIDTSFVRQHMLCGKTWMRVGGTAVHERWGSARSSKVVRGYLKVEASAFRIELQLHARFLRKHQINHACDFSKLATILSGPHIYFAALDGNKLRQYLQRSSFPHKTKTAILKTVAENRKSLWSTLRLLRRKWRFANVRRLLIPLTEMNGIVIAALNQWATQWEKQSTPCNLDKTQEQESR